MNKYTSAKAWTHQFGKFFLFVFFFHDFDSLLWFSVYNNYKQFILFYLTVENSLRLNFHGSHVFVFPMKNKRGP